MSMCTNLRCNGTDWLCGKCKKLYPLLAASLAEKRRNRGGNNRRGAGPIARGIAAAGIIGAVHGSTTLPMTNETPLRDAGTNQAQGERRRQGGEQRGATRDRGRRTGGSGQN